MASIRLGLATLFIIIQIVYADLGSDKNLLSLLTCNAVSQGQENKGPKKLYRADFKAMDIEYVDGPCYRIDKETIPFTPEISLSVFERKHLQRFNHCVKNHEEIAWHLEYMNDTIGYGAFTDQDVKKGDYIAEYTGIIVDEDYINNNLPYDLKYAWTIMPPMYCKTPKKFVVDGREAGNFTRFINHSYNPNVVALVVYNEDEWHMVYVACKDIKAGQQLLVDYGKGYWYNREPQELQE